ncbi:DnaJ like chaperone protein [Breznakibacter xylanolyticus]|uniref:DnaJ like chaperone protein n=1 Tax=Breznakibacter xylanolyticus TaxID=990 RepID=A0A2W7MSJ0_9BACT|nr:TerB family tellurite resistance protein [Breznakibacter xylanolyticus]PZX10918.1 DnaJ like chaperone protein [Breznakibacter xylanolyticus]
MGFLGSLIGATLGWWMGGPLGIIIGLIIGHVAQESSTASVLTDRDDQSRQSVGGFVASLLVLMGAVMKADGKVVHSELEFVKRYLVRTLGADKAQEALLMLRDILKQEIPVRDICLQVRINLDYASRLQLLHLLVGLGMADGVLSRDELMLIRQIAFDLGISEADLGSLENMYVDDVQAAYKVLEIAENASDDDVKKAYRAMAVRFHPDKVEHLGEDFKKSANEKFQRVNEAFEKIKKARGLK